jgi:hypothetical protein
MGECQSWAEIVKLGSASMIHQTGEMTIGVGRFSDARVGWRSDPVTPSITGLMGFRIRERRRPPGGSCAE